MTKSAQDDGLFPGGQSPVFSPEDKNPIPPKVESMDEKQIQSFWNAHPCGDHQVGGLERFRGDYEAFFQEYDAFRYRKEKHILACLDGLDLEGKKVLEVGLGEGADSEQLIRRGAIWTGLDLTSEAVERVKIRLALRNLPHEGVHQGSILQAPFPDQTFDMVFSHGVLHHVPDIQQAQREIRRILKDDGELVAMVYAKWSINYLVSIALVRRLGLLILVAFGVRPEGILGQHVDNARQQGIWNYLRLENFVHHNTDGPLNPFSRVYDLKRVTQDFPDFRITRSYKRFLHGPPLPLHWLPSSLERLLGWHLWVHLWPRN